MKRVGVGRYRHYITITTVSDGVAEDGTPAKTETTLASNVPANVMTVSGTEGIRGRQVDATATHLVETRYRSDVNPSDKITDHLSRTLNIIAINDKDGRERHMILQCKSDR